MNLQFSDLEHLIFGVAILLCMTALITTGHNDPAIITPLLELLGVQLGFKLGGLKSEK